VLAHLQDSIAGASDPSQRFTAAAYALRYFTLGAEMAVDPRHRFGDVQAALTAALLAAFSFAARDLGQSVTEAEIMALAHTVAGVNAIEIVQLLPYSDAPLPPDTVLEAVPSFGARYDTPTAVALPAELLLINPAAIAFTEMTP
jgi:hypothetical protein